MSSVLLAELTAACERAWLLGGGAHRGAGKYGIALAGRNDPRHLDRTDVSLISQAHLEFFSGKNFVKPNAFNPLRAAPVLKSRV